MQHGALFGQSEIRAKVSEVLDTWPGGHACLNSHSRGSLWIQRAK